MDGYKYARALICSTFGGYTFRDVDDLTLEEVAELTGAAQYLIEEYNKQSNGRGRRRR